MGNYESEIFDRLNKAERRLSTHSESIESLKCRASTIDRRVSTMNETVQNIQLGILEKIDQTRKEVLSFIKWTVYIALLVAGLGISAAAVLV